MYVCIVYTIQWKYIQYMHIIYTYIYITFVLNYLHAKLSGPRFTGVFSKVKNKTQRAMIPKRQGELRNLKPEFIKTNFCGEFIIHTLTEMITNCSLTAIFIQKATKKKPSRSSFDSQHIYKHTSLQCTFQRPVSRRDN